MKLPVIRGLAEKYSVEELDEAALLFEEERKNIYQVEGKDEGEILSHLLMAAVVRGKMDRGLSLQEALREHAKTVQNLLTDKE